MKLNSKKTFEKDSTLTSPKNLNLEEMSHVSGAGDLDDIINPHTPYPWETGGYDDGGTGKGPNF